MSPQGQTFIDSRDSPVLIVHKGIPELAESDRLGTWGGVRVGGPGVSSPQGYPPLFYPQPSTSGSPAPELTSVDDFIDASRRCVDQLSPSGIG